MIISWNVISHDEMFDVYKVREVAVDRLCLRVEGKMVNGTKGNMDDLFIGRNSSTEGPEGEGPKSTVIPGVDIVMNHHLQETSFKKKPTSTSKGTLNQSKGNEELRPEGVQPFMTGATEQIQHILANFKNCQFFIGESVHPDGMVALLEYLEDSMTPYMISFKDGSEMEKC